MEHFKCSLFNILCRIGFNFFGIIFFMSSNQKPVSVVFCLSHSLLLKYRNIVDFIIFRSFFSLDSPFPNSKTFLSASLHLHEHCVQLIYADGYLNHYAFRNFSKSLSLFLVTKWFRHFKWLLIFFVRFCSILY